MATGRIGVTPVLRTRWSKQPTAGTTSLSGLDDNSVSLVYDVGYEAVYRNGVLLSRGNDYTATSGTSITLIDATLTGDIVEVFANDLVPLTDAISKGQYTAKGALLSATAASTPGVLTVGSNNQVLTADSTTSTGLKWATPAAGGMTLLSTTTLSGATTTISGISGSYNQLLVIVSGAVFGTTDSQIYILPNGGTSFYGICNRNSGGAVSQVSLLNTRIRTGQNATNTGGNNVIAVRIENYANTSYYKSIIASGYHESPSGDTGFDIGGAYLSNSAITSIDVTTASGYTFSAGQVLIYGVK